MHFDSAQHIARLRAQRAGRLCRRHRLPSSRRPVRLLHERQLDADGRQPCGGAMGLRAARGVWADRAVRDRRRGRQPDRARPRRQSPALAAAGRGVAARRRARSPTPSACRMSRSPRSCWRWGWRTRCSRSTAAPVSASPMSPARWSRSANSGRRGADRRRALGLGCRNLLLWAALVAGSVCGALAYHWINLAAIWFAAGSGAGAERDRRGDRRTDSIDSERGLPDLSSDDAC